MNLSSLLFFWNLPHPINRIRYQINDDCIKFSRIYRHFSFGIWQIAPHMVSFYFTLMEGQTISDLIFQNRLPLSDAENYGLQEGRRYRRDALAHLPLYRQNGILSSRAFSLNGPNLSWIYSRKLPKAVVRLRISCTSI